MGVCAVVVGLGLLAVTLACVVVGAVGTGSAVWDAHDTTSSAIMPARTTQGTERPVRCIDLP
jgi:hypothetical protein